MRRASKVDNNHADIRNGLRTAGYRVHDTSSTGNGFPDLMVESKSVDPIFVLIEAKTKKGKLTSAQKDFHYKHRRGPLHVLRSLEAALLIMERYDKVRFD